VELHQRLLLSCALLAACGAATWEAAAQDRPPSPAPPAALPAPDRPAATPALASAQTRFAQLGRLAAQGARVSALVWDLESGQPLAELGATERLTPASLTKIVAAAAALETWPPDHTFPTELRSARSPVAGVVEGDLVVRGSGDATLDETTLWALAAQLRSAGISRIRGRVLVERAPFGELLCDTVDRCNSLRSSARAYNAAPSAIGVNYGSWCVMVRAPAGATRADVSGCASGPLPLPLTGSVQVSSGGPALSVERSTADGQDRIRVGGSIAPGTERMIHRAMSDPAVGAGQLLRSILLQAGMQVEGAVETTLNATGLDARLLAKVESIPLQEQVGRMMRWSNNYIADVLTMGVALRTRGTAPASLADASGVLTDLVRRAAGGGVATGLVLESGSGLTASNRISAQDLVHVLRAAWRDTRRFPAFYGTFVVPRDASFTYLRRGGNDWLDRVALKTGSLTQPVSVNGIAGYLRKKSGGFMAFAIIVNGSERLRQVPQETALSAARADLEALLASY
jgi:D-alanyl-D-alanine carboxypeptidase/D-alanyl-D-alanine-endopeptidase (penicillin-binding protein 4)